MDPCRGINYYRLDPSHNMYYYFIIHCHTSYLCVANTHLTSPLLLAQISLHSEDPRMNSITDQFLRHLMFEPRARLRVE